MTLSIIIPVFNESETIVSVLRSVAGVRLPWKKEIIVVDDGSTDGTREHVAAYGKNCPLIAVFHQSNMGKGAAIRSGVSRATGHYILIQDADLEYNPDEISQLLSPLTSQKPTPHARHLIPPIAVYGSRFLQGRPSIPLLYYLGNRFLTTFTNILFRTSLTDMETGYKLLPASFMKSLSFRGQRFEIEPEITARLVTCGVGIVEVPISYRGRSHLAGKKLTVRDAFAALMMLVRIRFFD